MALRAMHAVTGCLSFAAGALLGAPSHAADGLPSLDELAEVMHSAPLQVNLTVDNDAFIPSRTTDRYYTGGEQLLFRLPSTRVLQAAPASEADPAPRGLRYAYGFRIGQQVFTPENIDLPPSQLSQSDRPYAGWLYAGLFKETFWADGSGGRYLRLGLDVGCLGPCGLGEQSQDLAHNLFSGDHAEGWNAQIHNGPGAQLNGVYSPRRFMLRPSLEITPYASAEVGNVYTNGAAGVSVRAGHLVSPFRSASQYRDLVPNLLAAEDSAGGGAGEAFVFGRIQLRAVAYDATLQGGWSGHSSHTVDPERFPFEQEWGAAYKARSWAISYSLTIQSTQVKAQPFSWTWHRWARVQVAWMF